MDHEKNYSLRDKIHDIIFETETPAGKYFDIFLLIAIILSVLVVMLESVSSLHDRYFELFYILEWIFTILFSIEYILRLYSVRRPLSYAFSYFGIVDLLAILPTYLSLFVAGTQYLLVIRALRLLRVFRIFKLGHYIQEGTIIINALKKSRVKISVFLFFVLLMVTIVGSIMYLIEGGVNPRFTSIPRGVYWAIVTLTTVGYGDISPITPLGQFLSAIVMIMGYAVIAVPTGIVSAELVKKDSNDNNTINCRYCGLEGHARDAVYCRRCGERLNP